MIPQEQIDAAETAEAPAIESPAAPFTEELEEGGVYLDLACGQTKKEGYLGVDIAECEGVDFVVDLAKTPWPFDTESVSGVWCSHFVEHLEGVERMDFWSELYRILKPGAKAVCITPFGWSDRALQDPTHKWPPIVANSYLYVNENWRRANSLTHGPYERLQCNFDSELSFIVLDNWNARPDEAKQMAMMHYINVIPDMVATLIKKPRLAEETTS